MKTPEQIQTKRLKVQIEHEIAVDPPGDHAASAYYQGWLDALRWVEAP